MAKAAAKKKPADAPLLEGTEGTETTTVQKAEETASAPSASNEPTGAPASDEPREEIKGGADNSLKGGGTDRDAILINVKAETLLKAVDAVAAIPERKASIAILEHALLTVGRDGRASVLMTDLEIEGEAWLDMSVSAPWSGILPSEIVAFIRARPEGEIGLTIAADGSSIRASQGRARMTVAILTADDFPRLTPPDEEFSFDLPAAELCDALTRVAAAVAGPDDNRAFLQGVNMKCVEDKLVFATTDGMRLHRERIPAPDGAEHMPSLIVPTKSVSAIVKAFANRAGAVRVFGSREKIAVTGPDISIVTKLIGGTYPPIEQIIPQPSDDQIRVDAKELAASLACMRALKDDSAKGSSGRGMKFGFGEGLLSLSVTRKGTADRIEDGIAGESGGQWENGVKPEFLQAALAQAGVKEVTLARGLSDTPSILVDTGTPDRLFLIMCRSVF